MTREKPDHEIVIVGAGFSGIGAGIMLKKAGFEDFVIAEQTDTVGGTWRDNTYPGVAVDITSFTYSFSFEPNPYWSRTYAPGHELQAYAEHCVDKYDLRRHIRFNTRVVESRFDEDQHLWRGTLEDGSEVTARFVLGATGGLTQPKIPDIPGLKKFKGKSFHTARWEHDVDLTGKRVAVIGTGASALQVIPKIAPIVEQLDGYQRTPIWVLPKVDPEISPRLQSAFARVPATQASLRVATNVATEAVMVLGVIYQKQFPLLTRGVEAAAKAFLRGQVPDKELRRKLTPHYGFGCKRPSFSNTYLKSFMRDDVELVTDGIQEITATGIRAKDGTLRPVDVIVLATGFKVFELGNTPPFPVYGVGGVELGAFWDENRYQAYEGVTNPQFPNMFPILAPYSISGASYFFMIEASMTHTIRCIREARKRGATYVAVRQEPHDVYFADILKRQRSTIFINGNCGGSNSWYFDKHGDAPQVRPSTAPEMWWRARHFNLEHYEYRSLPPVVDPRSRPERVARLAEVG